MAKVNPVKLKQEAEKLEKGGRPDQAIALYRQIVDDNPRDWNVINKIGDLYAKLNRTKEAGDEYAKVADFYAKDGFLLKAIAIWKKINKLDASALEPYQNLAELYAKQGLMMEAKAQYQIVIDEFIKRGRTRDAGETLRKMAEIDPADLKVRSKLADLYTREGSTEKAVGEHVAIAEELNKKGHLAEALQVLEKGLKIDPRSDRLRLELARVHLIQKNYDKAAHYLEEAVQRSHSDPVLLGRLGEAYLGGKKIEEAEAIFKRLLELDPGDDEARAQMGRVYLQQDRFDDAFRELQPAVERMIARREGDKAAALLQQITQRNPQHATTLQKLAEVYRTFAKEGPLASTLSQLTEALIAEHEFEPAAAALEELVRRDPQNQQHRNKLDFVKGKLSGGGAGRAPSPASPSAIDFEEEEFDLGTPSSPAPTRSASPAAAPRPAPAAPAPPAAAPTPPARVPLEASGPLSEEDREFIDEHVAEGRVFRKYGLLTKAIDQFEAVVARFPDHLEARQELREAYRDDNKPAKVAEQCLALADIFRMKGDETAALAQEEEAQRLVPAPVPAAKPAAPRAAPAEAPPPPKPEARPEPAGVSLDFEEPEETAEEEEIALDSEADEAPLALGDDEEISLDVDEPLSGSAREEPGLLDLDGEVEGELGGFLDDVPLAADTDLLTEPDLAAAEAVEAPDPEDLSAVEVEIDDEMSLPDEVESAAEPELAEETEVTFGEDEDLHIPEPEPEPEPEAEPEAPTTVLDVSEEEFELPDEDLGLPQPEPEPAAVLFGEDPLAGMRGDGGAGEVSLDFEEDLPLDEDLPLEVDEPFPVAVPAFAIPEPEPPRAPAPPPEPARVQAPARAAAAPAAAPVSPAMVRVLDEVDQYMALGFVDDARDALRELVARHPNHPAILAKLDELGMELEVGEPAAPPAELADELLGGDLEVELDEETVADEPEAVDLGEEAALDDETPAEAPGFGALDDEIRFDEVSLDDEPVQPEVDEGPGAEEPPQAAEEEVLTVSEAAPDDPGIDLAAELDDLFTAQPAVEEPVAESVSSELGDSGLAEIFKEFKRGVDKQLGQEDYDTRYNLGIAYKEMGLVDEAIAEFQLAAKDPQRLLECSSMLGICFLDKGMPKLAIKWFEKGLRAPGRSDEEYVGLRYDLASAHEAAGDMATALGIFTELYGQDANFRDVAAKVRELRSQA